MWWWRKLSFIVVVKILIHFSTLRRKEEFLEIEIVQLSDFGFDKNLIFWVPKNRFFILIWTCENYRDGGVPDRYCFDFLGQKEESISEAFCLLVTLRRRRRWRRRQRRHRRPLAARFKSGHWKILMKNQRQQFPGFSHLRLSEMMDATVKGCQQDAPTTIGQFFKRGKFN